MNPAIFVSRSVLRPFGIFTSPAKCWTTNAVLTFGWLGEPVGHLPVPAPGSCRGGSRGSSFVVARMTGQPERVIDTPRQRLRCATTSSAARQCEAWLSPSSAIVPRASAAGTPNSHGAISPSTGSGVHGEFCWKTASSGVGTTAVRS